MKVPIEPALEKLKTLPQEKHIIPATSKAVKSKMYVVFSIIYDKKLTRMRPKTRTHRYSIVTSPRHSKTRTTNKKKLMKRKNTPHPVKGILKRKHLARTESSYAYALRSMANLFTQHDKEVANDLKTLKIVAGSLLAGAAVGLGVYYYSKRRRWEGEIVALIIFIFDTTISCNLRVRQQQKRHTIKSNTDDTSYLSFLFTKSVEDPFCPRNIPDVSILEISSTQPCGILTATFLTKYFS